MKWNEGECMVFIDFFRPKISIILARRTLTRQILSGCILRDEKKKIFSLTKQMTITMCDNDEDLLYYVRNVETIYFSQTIQFSSI